MSPELKKAIIKILPDYFLWDENRQEQYRVDTPEEDAFKVRQFLLRELFNIPVSNEDEVEEAWRAMNEAQCLKINAILLPIQGIGEDFFYLNEAFCSPKNLLSFETLYDYDFDDYKFQEASRIREQKGYKKKPSRGSLYLTWARLMLAYSFSYGVLSMVAGYLYSQLDEYGNDYIEKLIPHKFKHGKNHGKAQGLGYLYDLKIDAKGLESQLDELKHRFFNHINDVHERLMENFDPKIVRFRKKHKVIFHRDSGLDELLD